MPFLIGERLQGCYEFGKQFTDTRNLKAHMYIHTGVKSHDCGVSAKQFRQPQN